MASPSDIRIDPSPEEFVAAVRRSLARVETYYTFVATVGAGHDVSTADILKVLARVHNEADGWHDWMAAPGRGARVVWWTDHVRRKHVRVRSVLGLDDEAPGPFRPPLMALYPGACVGVHRFGRMHLVGLCDCGAWGDPASLGWMGPTCGPCHDRGEGETFIPDHWQAAGSPIDAVALSAGGRVAVWADGAVTLWQAGPPRLVESWGERREVDALAFSPGGRYLAWEDLEGVRIHDLHSGRSITGKLTRFAFHPDGHGIYLFSPPDSLVLWDLQTETRRMACRVPSPIDLWCLAVSPDGRRVAGRTDDWLLIWDARGGEPLERVPLSGRGYVLAWSPDGATLAVGEGGSVRLVGAVRGRLGLEVNTAVRTAAFHPKGRSLMTASDEAVRAWTVRGGTEERSMAFDAMRCVALSPDGATLTVGTRDGRVRLVPAAVLWEG
jgi:hypothetical protein